MVGGNVKIRLGLGVIKRLLKDLSDPQNSIPIIHIGGTNGKGSISAYLDEILQGSGYRVGRFSSPFLIKPNDSITLNGFQIGDDEYRETRDLIKRSAIASNVQPTQFETLTAIAFKTFSREFHGLDLVIVEVGLGGDNDSTNVCDSENTLLSCITPIGLDHEAFLGSTIQEITSRKAGILKRNVPVILAEQTFQEVEQIIENRAGSIGAQVYKVPNYPNNDLSPDEEPPPPFMLPKIGGTEGGPEKTKRTISNPLSARLNASFQHQNAFTAVSIAHALRTHSHPLGLIPSLSNRITDGSIIDGIKRTNWRGRMEWTTLGDKNLSVLLDGAHNPAGASALGSYLSKLSKPITLIISLSSPRDPREFIKSLRIDRFRFKSKLRIIVTVFSRSSSSSNQDEEEDGDVRPEPVPSREVLKSIEDHFNDGNLGLPEVMISKDVSEALEICKKLKSDNVDDEFCVVVCGSLYLIGDVIRIIDKKKE